ncbi:alpha/beta fold hydrolase [Geodermatophilus ruber]|uniref:Alpha/beta hydrolase family protein n=1 Tax=Geodermatophilus ruber TaxID=504800 RepID=A0A1I4C9Y8_9ACTN|nr:alpha/beta fold hydrolase [Geodermatophilus ruber]SFK77137.1 Alpha/beta hydrolase family protein [Geodermatophilus ruber]
MTPHERAEPVHRRRGAFWLPGDVQVTGTAPWQLGPAWVQWEAPAELTGRPPMIFVHGGGGQSTDWMGTTGASVGWAELAVRHGFPAYLLDRPGHGRSPWDPARMGAKTPFPDYAGLEALLVPREGQRASAHTAWPWPREVGTPHVDAQAASSSGMLLDTPLSQELDARRLVDLLQLTGPAVVVVHSAGGPAGWLAADRRPDLVRCVVAVEPLGPPYRDMGPRGVLTEGPTAVPLHWEESASGRRLTNLAQVPACVVSAEASGRAEDDRETIAFLRDGGVSVDHVDLAEHGITGNGHGLTLEVNNAEIFTLVVDWVSVHAELSTRTVSRT